METEQELKRLQGIKCDGTVNLGYPQLSVLTYKNGCASRWQVTLAPGDDPSATTYVVDAKTKDEAIDVALAIDKQRREGFTEWPNFKAAIECDGLAAMLDICAGRATEHDHKTGQYGNWCHDAEILRMAARLLRRSRGEEFPFACWDCDPCLGGRPDQCALSPSPKLSEQMDWKWAALETALYRADTIVTTAQAFQSAQVDAISILLKERDQLREACQAALVRAEIDSTMQFMADQLRAVLKR